MTEDQHARYVALMREYYEKAHAFVDTVGSDPVTDQVLDLWGRTLKAVETADLSLIDR